MHTLPTQHLVEIFRLFINLHTTENLWYITIYYATTMVSYSGLWFIM